MATSRLKLCSCVGLTEQTTLLSDRLSVNTVICLIERFISEFSACQWIAVSSAPCMACVSAARDDHARLSDIFDFHPIVFTLFVPSSLISEYWPCRFPCLRRRHRRSLPPSISLALSLSICWGGVLRI